jgi:hypothetical protein
LLTTTAIDKRYVPLSSIERYRGKLPDQLLAYWEENGWCGYADGLFWTVNPQDYEAALEAWIGDTPLMEEDSYYVIARSAFGDLYLFGGDHCVFHANWTPVPPQTGHLFQRKLDTRSRPNWTPVPDQTGHLGRDGAGLRCGFTPDGANLSNWPVFSAANLLSS